MGHLGLYADFTYQVLIEVSYHQTSNYQPMPSRLEYLSNILTIFLFVSQSSAWNDFQCKPGYLTRHKKNACIEGEEKEFLHM